MCKGYLVITYAYISIHMMYDMKYTYKKYAYEGRRRAGSYLLSPYYVPSTMCEV